MRYPQQSRPPRFGQPAKFRQPATTGWFPSWVQIALALGSLFVLIAIVAALYGTPSPLANEPRPVTVATASSGPFN